MENLNNTSNPPKKIKIDFKDSKYATWRRKRSIAKVWVKKGSGNIYVNGIKMNDYFKRPVHQIIVTRPLEISNVRTAYDVKCSNCAGHVGFCLFTGAVCGLFCDGLLHLKFFGTSHSFDAHNEFAFADHRCAHRGNCKCLSIWFWVDAVLNSRRLSAALTCYG